MANKIMNWQKIFDFISNNDVTNILKNNDKGYSYKKLTGIAIVCMLYKLHSIVDATTLIMLAGIDAGLIAAIIGVNTLQQVVNKKEDNKSGNLPEDKTT